MKRRTSLQRHRPSSRRRPRPTRKRREAAEERARTARNERIKLEAEDPEKIIQYLRTLEPEDVDPLFSICKEEGIDLKEAWNDSVEAFGIPWNEYRSTVYAEDPEGNQIEPGFDDYVYDVVENLVFNKRLGVALGRHSGDIYAFTCWSCKERYEFELKERYTAFSCPNGCKTEEEYESFYRPCPVCRDLGRENSLFYDPVLNLLFCRVCKYMRGIQGPPLEKKGTRGEPLERSIAELEGKRGALEGELKMLQRRNEAERLQGEKRSRALEQTIKEGERTLEKLSKAIATLDAETEENRRECAAERRRAEELKGENKLASARREVINAVAEFLMDPELITGEQLANVVKTLSATQKMRGQQGRVGESVKMTVETRDHLLKMVAGKDFILKSKADEIREREIDKLKAEYEGKLKVKDSKIDVERRKRAEAELRLGEAMKIVNSPMVRGIKGLLTQSLDEERIMASS